MRGLNLTGFCAKLRGQNEALLFKTPAGTAVGIEGLCNFDFIKFKFGKKRQASKCGRRTSGV